MPIARVVTRGRIMVGVLLLGIVAFLLLMNWPTLQHRRQAAFIAAALRGNVYRMKLLLVFGASPEEAACNTSLCPRPLIAASIGGNPTAVQLLFEHGATVNGKMKRGQSALTMAAYEGHSEVVRLLLTKGADVNADWEGCTALESARQRRHAEIVDVLLKAGANKAGHCNN